VLEFFGDSVLSTAIISLMLKEKTERYEHGVYTQLNEGDFSNIRSKLSDKRNLSGSMALLGLQKYLLMGEGDAKLGVENEPSVMEDLFESIIGAVYIDCGMNIDRVIKVVSKILDTSVYFSAEAAPIQSYKNALQEWCADKKHRLPAPVYKTVSESGPDHKRLYERAVYIGDRLVATGKGKNQKIADSAAAEAALEILKSENQPKKEINLESITKLKALAVKNKQPSPEFRDLGESERSTPASSKSSSSERVKPAGEKSTA
jgi:ribonuclease-3